MKKFNLTFLLALTCSALSAQPEYTDRYGDVIPDFSRVSYRWGYRKIYIDR